jgi:WD40 repeat protein
VARGARRTDIRIGHDARAAATGTLDTALREGRLDLAEYERRLVVIQAATVQQDLTPAITDLPSRHGQRGAGLRISTVDREQALVRLAEALSDGRIEAVEYVGAEEMLRRAVTYADVDAVVGDLDARASLVERQQAVERVEAAVADGLLDPAEQHGRVAAVRNATTDAQLAALVADLTTNTRSPDAPVRVSNADREAAAAQLHDAVEAGFLDLTEFDERVRAVYAARLRSELTGLLDDLPDPARPPAPPPPGTPRREWKMPRHEWIPGTGYVLTLYSVVGTLLFGSFAYYLVALGLGGWAVLPGVIWLLIFVLIVRHGRRPVERLPGLSGHQRPIWTMTCLVLPDGTPVAISGAQDNTAMVWDLAAHAPRQTLSGHTHDVVDVAAMVLPDGTPVAVTISKDTTAVVWDLRDGSPRGTLPGMTGESRSVTCFTLPDGTPTVICLSSDAIRLWDLRNLRELNAFGADPTVEAIVPVVLSGGDPVVVVMPNNLDHVLHVKGLENGEVRLELSGHTDSLTAIDVAVLPDGTPVAVSASLDKTIRVWDLRQGTLLRTIGMAFARQHVICSSLPDGTPIAVGAVLEDFTRVWDLRDGTELRTIGLQGGPIAGVALADRTLVVGTISDGSVVGVYPLSFR